MSVKQIVKKLQEGTQASLTQKIIKNGCGRIICWLPFSELLLSFIQFCNINTVDQLRIYPLGELKILS